MTPALKTAAQQVRSAHQRIVTQEQSIARDRERIADLKSQIQRDCADFDEIAKSASDRNLLATLEGVPLPVPPADESERLRALKASREAAEAAIPVIQAAISDQEKDLIGERRTLADHFWPWKALVLDQALGDVSATLAGLGRPLVQLLALQDVQEGLLGKAFGTHATDKRLLVSSSKLAEKLLAGIPEKLMPPEIDPALLMASARHEANQMRATLENADG